MQWLNKYTFPAERRLSDLNVARDVYDRAVRAFVRAGTTTAACKLPACLVLCFSHERTMYYGFGV
jgi:cytosine/adenosine deaminase-related metal-dependent hydrolase